MKKNTWSLIFNLVAGLVLFCTPAQANNASITNVRLLDCDASANTALVEFDISWHNSWRDSANYDAVWIFVKGKWFAAIGDPNEEYYAHVTLSDSGTNPSGFSRGSGTLIDIIVPTDKKGAFIQRSQPGSGSVATTDIQLKIIASTVGAVGWDCGNENGQANVYVYGIEMVYVPEGGFHVGDGNNGATNFEFEYGSSSSLPAPINSESGISFSNVSGGGWYYNSTSATPEFTAGSVFNVPSSFPKGYSAYYAMKYEISAGQYVAFLNNLSRSQQYNRVASAVSGNAVTNNFVMSNTTSSQNRNRVTCPTGGNGTATPITFSASSSVGAGRDNRALNYLSWMDVAAYADWAALRPLTEFEFEKLARGPIYPLASEYAWGTTSATQGIAISGTEIGTEYITTASANCDYDSLVPHTGGDTGSGPLRCGIFATSATATRQTSGAGYYGSLELSGNVREFYVTVGNSAGLSFSGTHGDGVLTNISGTTYDGNATNLDWPGIDATDQSRGVTAATGAGMRGGGRDATGSATHIRVSYRNAAADVTNAGTRGTTNGGRLGRTAP